MRALRRRLSITDNDRADRPSTSNTDEIIVRVGENIRETIVDYVQWRAQDFNNSG